VSAVTPPSTHGWRPSARRALPLGRAVDVLSVVCVLLAAVLWLWPASSDVRAEPANANANANASTIANAMPVAMAVAPPLRAPGLMSAADSLVAAVVAGNVFSASRRAPTTRFMPPGSITSDAPTSNAALLAPTPTGVADADALPRLTGIITLNGERQALVQLTAGDGVPRLYRAGDSHAGYRIERIGADFVVLTLRTGTRTLRLNARALPDSLEVPQ
jgi:hypothetical protein